MLTAVQFHFFPVTAYSASLWKPCSTIWYFSKFMNTKRKGAHIHVAFPGFDINILWYNSWICNGLFISHCQIKTYIHASREQIDKHARSYTFMRQKPSWMFLQMPTTSNQIRYHFFEFRGELCLYFEENKEEMFLNYYR